MLRAVGMGREGRMIRIRYRPAGGAGRAHTPLLRAVGMGRGGHMIRV